MQRRWIATHNQWRDSWKFKYIVYKSMPQQRKFVKKTHACVTLNKRFSNVKSNVLRFMWATEVDQRCMSLLISNFLNVQAISALLSWVCFIVFWVIFLNLLRFQTHIRLHRILWLYLQFSALEHNLNISTTTPSSVLRVSVKNVWPYLLRKFCYKGVVYSTWHVKSNDIPRK